MILGYLHREYIDPNFLDKFVPANKDTKFEISNKLDDMGCTPKCAAHLVFGLQTIDVTSCNQCEFVDEVNNVETSFIDQYYVDEVLNVAKKQPQMKLP